MSLVSLKKTHMVKILVAILFYDHHFKVVRHAIETCVLTISSSVRLLNYLEKYAKISHSVIPNIPCSFENLFFIYLRICDYINSSAYCAYKFKSQIILVN